MVTTTELFVICVFLAGMSLMYAIFGGLQTTSNRQERRVRELLGKAESKAPTKRTKRRFIRPLSVEQRPSWTVRFFAEIGSMLKKAEIDLTPQDFVFRWGLGTLVLGIFAFIAGGILAFLGVLVTGIGSGWWFLRFLARRRLTRFNNGLYDTLQIMSNALRAGHSFVQAMNMVVQDMHGPIQEEFERITNELQVGVGVETALQSAANRVGSEDFDLVVTGVMIQRQLGGNLAEILEKIAFTIRERVKIQREVKALTAQGRLSANIFVLLPVGVGFMVYLTDPSYIDTLFITSIGKMLLGAGFTSQMIGYFLIRKIVKVEL